MIDTTVEGTPSSVRAAATFLGTTLKDAVEDAGDDAQGGRSRALGSWDGEASAAYRGFGRELVQAADDQVGHLREAKEKFDAYAGKLERTQTRMGTRRGEASAAGLVVNAMVIERPADAVALTDPGPGASTAQSDQHTADTAAYDAQVIKIETYNRLHGEVAEDHESLAQWVHDNLDAFWTVVNEPSGATVLADVLQKLPSALTGAAFDGRARALRERAAASRTESARLREDAREARASRRSGNPARRAAGAGVDVPGNRSTARTLDALAEGTETVARRLPIIGTVLTLGMAGADIANGESPSTVIVGEVGGIVGGVVGAAAVVAVVGAGAPVIAVAAGAAVVGIGVGLAAEYAYENWVPDDVRESIDEGLEDFGEGLADVASDVGDAVTFWN